MFNICQRFAAKGETGLVSGKRGRKPDEQKLLTTAQEAEIKRLICRHMPDELGLDFALWSRAAVRALIRRQYGVRLAVRTTGRGGSGSTRAREQQADIIAMLVEAGAPRLTKRRSLP